jgi:uncharacterized protein (DUF433 family)
MIYQPCFGIMNKKSPASFVESDPEKMGGTLVFQGTRVPVRNLIDYLNAGDSIETFLDDFPTVSREQVLGAISSGEIRKIELKS